MWTEQERAEFRAAAVREQKQARVLFDSATRDLNDPSTPTRSTSAAPATSRR
jgi:hypothetical protein